LAEAEAEVIQLNQILAVEVELELAAESEGMDLAVAVQASQLEKAIEDQLAVEAVDLLAVEAVVQADRADWDQRAMDQCLKSHGTQTLVYQ
jgi:hypothetical protein